MFLFSAGELELLLTIALASRIRTKAWALLQEGGREIPHATENQKSANNPMRIRLLLCNVLVSTLDLCERKKYILITQVTIHREQSSED